MLKNLIKMIQIIKLSYINIKKTKKKERKKNFFSKKKIQNGLFSRMFFWVKNEEIVVFIFLVK